MIFWLLNLLMLLFVLLGYFYFIRRRTGYFQDAVLVIFQQVDDITFPTDLGKLAGTGKRFVFSVLELHLQFVDLYEILLTAVSATNIYDQERTDQQE